MASKDEAAIKSRIITHMNAQHQPSLTRYLQNYLHLSSFSSRNPTLINISLSNLSIRTGSKIHTIPLSPPLPSLSESRSRLVLMDEECIKNLNLSPETITTYLPPQSPRQRIVFGLVIFGFIALSRKENFLPGTWLTNTVLKPVPSVAEILYRNQPLTIAIMLIVHIAEALYMARSRLRRHSVPMGTRLWWTWIASTFFEGFGAFERFDVLVRSERERREKSQH